MSGELNMNYNPKLNHHEGEIVPSNDMNNSPYHHKFLLPKISRPKVFSLIQENYLSETIKIILDKLDDSTFSISGNGLPKFSEEYKKIEDRILQEKKKSNSSLTLENESSKPKENPIEKNLSPKNQRRNVKTPFTIDEIITIVNKWRSLCYEENLLPHSNLKSKEEAARIVNIKKKSLDDYLMFLRLGISMKFEFQNNGTKNFNFLRKYIKSIRPRIHWNKNDFLDVDSLIENVK